MNINLSGVDWMFLGLMMGLAFVAALLGSLIAFRNRFVGRHSCRDIVRRRLRFLELLPAQFRAADPQDHRSGQHDDVSDGRGAAGSNDAVTDESHADGAAVARNDRADDAGPIVAAQSGFRKPLTGGATGGRLTFAAAALSVAGDCRRIWRRHEQVACGRACRVGRRVEGWHDHHGRRIRPMRHSGDTDTGYPRLPA